jgi:hypothetical protein
MDGYALSSETRRRIGKEVIDHSGSIYEKQSWEKE